MFYSSEEKNSHLEINCLVKIIYYHQFAYTTTFVKEKYRLFLGVQNLEVQFFPTHLGFSGIGESSISVMKRSSVPTHFKPLKFEIYKYVTVT